MEIPEIGQSNNFHDATADLQSGYDIGNGTPEEILRELDLTESLLSLYFDNFSDIHFMFDRHDTLREVRMNGISKTLLFAMMALGIRYLSSPLFTNKHASHRGEVLFHEARRLFRDNYDQPSVETIQMFILLGTYHLTFGGVRRSWIYLGNACTIARALRLLHNPLGSDAAKSEMCRRLICTIALMDRTLSPSIDLPCYLASDQIANPSSEERFQSMKRGILFEGESNGNMIAEIMYLSRLFQEGCILHRSSSAGDDWAQVKLQHGEWHRNLHPSLAWSDSNFGFHVARKTIRQYVYMHILDQHISQLMYFKHLKYSNRLETNRSAIAQCYHHAGMLTEIVEHTWETVFSDLHNVMVGQALTVACAVHVHARLMAQTPDEYARCQTNISIVKACFSRIRHHCRIFARISVQLETFLRLCERQSTVRSMFDDNNRLIRLILHYGSSYEQTRNQISSLEDPSITSAKHIEQEDLENQSREEANGSASAVDENFGNYAWMFSDTSLDDLFSLPFMESAGLRDVSWQ